MPSAPLQRPEADDVNFAWLVRLRWFPWAAQAGLLAWASLGLGLQVPVGWVLTVIGFALLSNGAAWWWHRRGGRATQASLQRLMIADTVLNTADFFFTGGVFNPFTALYLVNVMLGTLVLSRGRQWAQLAVSAAAFASLYGLERLAPATFGRLGHHEVMRLHLTGMLLAFALAATFIVYFMQRVQSSAHARETELASARKLAALTTLATGAAHELSTPLGTIALAAKELERALECRAVPPQCMDDLRLVRAEVERCRAILRGMAATSGVPRGEPWRRFSVRAWVDDAVAELPGAVRVLRPQPSSDLASDLQIEGPRAALTQALRNLVHNALDASPAEAPVRVGARRDGDRLVLEVSDEGSGIPASALARVGEPFYTTKEPGAGMGLGVFLARTLATQLGGTLCYAPGDTRGTTARLELPMASAWGG